MSLVPDNQARVQAIDPSLSFAVAAPAGSGKTELLIQRTLALLATAEVPENILGITFTRKAAAEMRTRILDALRAADLDTPAETAHEHVTLALAGAALRRDRELEWQLLANPLRLRFQTIDSLCGMLAKQLCLETGIILPPDISVDPAALYRQAAERTLEFLDDPGPRGTALRLIVSHLDGNLENLCTMLANLLASRDSWLPLIVPGQIDDQYLNERTEALVEEALSSALHALAPYANDLESALAHAVAHRDDAGWLDAELNERIPEATSAALPQWRALRKFLLTGDYGSARYRSPKVDKRLGFPPESDRVSRSEATAYKESFANLLNALGQDAQTLPALNQIAILPNMQAGDENEINRALFTLLPLTAAAFSTLCQERGETDYTEVAMAATRALGEPENPTPLALRLDYRIQHILVDEFQDTSSMQVELLKRLTAGWQPDDGRTLFIVGDGMQSIYGFRKANVSLFIRARHQGIGPLPLTPLDLTANFRSESQIVDWVNNCFEQLLPTEDNLVQGQVAFQSAQAVQPASNWAVTLRGFLSDQAEAEGLAEDIANKLAQGERDLAILVRGRSHLKAILPALRARDIRWQAQDIDPLVNRMAVMDAHSLLRALCMPADRIAWLSVLRAPWAGLDMADLLQVGGLVDAKDKQPPTIWHAMDNALSGGRLSDHGTDILKRLTTCFGRAFERLGKHNLRVTLETLWRDLDAPDALLEQRDSGDIEDYLNLVEELESGGLIRDWRAFERRLRELYAKPEDAGGDASAAHGLQIMTIHKSKGLEFDHVYVPALHRTVGRNDSPLLIWWEREYQDGSDGYLLAARPGIQGKNGDQTLYDYLRAEEAGRQRQEIGRLLYVACTRAAQSLWLSGSLSMEDDGQTFRRPRRGSMLEALWEQHGDSFRASCDISEPEELAEVQVLEGMRRLPPSRALADMPESESPQLNPAPERGGVPGQKPGAPFSKQYLARHVGTLIHHSLMRIVREPIDNPTPEVFATDWRRSLATLGLDGEQVDEALARLSSLLDSMTRDARGRWLLDTSHEESAAELEIEYLDDLGQVRLAVLDRTFIENGVRWIIDYKSSAPGTGEDVDDFIAVEVERYREQMAAYRRLFEQEDVRCMLYFPAIAAGVELTG